MRGPFAIFIVLAGLGLAAISGIPACGVVFDNVPRCNPREATPCLCNTGGPGRQVCHDDGLDYGPCHCTEDSADAGVDAGADAGVDASADAGIDAGGEAGGDPDFADHSTASAPLYQRPHR